MSSTASASALAISILASQDLYYNIEVNPGVGIFTSVYHALFYLHGRPQRARQIDFLSIGWLRSCGYHA